MAVRPIVCVGDKTSHGGTVIEGFASYSVYGRLAAGLGHRVDCPKCKGHHVIAEGAPSRNVNGVPMATDGMLTSCGAMLIASQTKATAEAGNIASESLGFGGADDASGAAASSVPASEREPSTDHEFIQQFVVLDEANGEPAPARRYRLTIDGVAFEGRTDDNGMTQRVTAKSALSVLIEVLAEGA